jgi:hypothetical protein|eukprot:COSAG06_NODE_2179_length_7405_cov_69.786614_8_plen_82_part_00
MDAMSDAIEGADVMLYGVSLRYKESANVRACHTQPAGCRLYCTARSVTSRFTLTVSFSVVRVCVRARALVTSVPDGARWTC